MCLQIHVIRQAHYLLGRDPALGLLAFVIHIADEELLFAINSLPQFGRELDPFVGPDRRVVDPDIFIERLVEFLQAVHHAKEDAAGGMGIVQGTVGGCDRDVERLGNGVQAVGRKVVVLAGQHERVDQVGDDDLALQTVELTVQELDIELGIVTDDHRPPQPFGHFIGDLRKQGFAGQLLIGKPVGAGGPNRKRTLGVHKRLVLLFDAPALGQDNAHLTDAVPEPGRQARGFKV